MLAQTHPPTPKELILTLFFLFNSSYGMDRLGQYSLYVCEDLSSDP